MNLRDPKIIALLFNECINNRDIEGLARLMTEDHTFIDRENTTVKSKQDMIASWSKFFKAFPIYKNTFDRIESYDDIVIMIGHAYWSKDNKYDRAIWSARIRNDLVAEWRVYYDNDENRRSLKVI